MDAKTAVRPVSQPKGRTTFASADDRTFTPAIFRTKFTPARTKYANANAYLVDSARPRGEKIVLLKKLVRGDVRAQRIALTHLAKPAWIYYLKRHDNKLVRFVEKLAKREISFEQYIEQMRDEVDVEVTNEKLAHRIWKQIKGEVLTRRMRAYIGDRCDFFGSRLKKLEKRGLERLYKSVTSFRPPRECR